LTLERTEKQRPGAVYSKGEPQICGCQRIRRVGKTGLTVRLAFVVVWILAKHYDAHVGQGRQARPRVDLAGRRKDGLACFSRALDSFGPEEAFELEEVWALEVLLQYTQPGWMQRLELEPEEVAL